MKKATVTLAFVIAAILGLNAIALPGHQQVYAAASTITVTTTSDELGPLATDTGTGCSLREAIHSANTDTAFGGCPAGSGVDEIVLPAGIYELTLGSQLAVASSLIIAGSGRMDTIVQGASSRGTASHRVFGILSGNATVTAVTIRYGKSSDGGGIRNVGSLVLKDVIIAENDGHSLDGGGIVNYGSLVLRDAVVSNNNVSGLFAGGGIANNNGDMTILDSDISGNEAAYGGGIYNHSVGATLEISTSTISDNYAREIGGGIYNQGPLTIENSSIVDNSANLYDGGGIYTGNADATITNSTIVGNQTVQRGGGIYHYNGTLTLTGSAVVGNGASRGGGIYNRDVANLSYTDVSTNTASSDGGGIFSYGGGVSTINTSTIMYNEGRHGGGIFNGIGSTLSVTRSTISYNIGGGILNNGDASAGGIMTLEDSTVSDNRENKGGGGGISTNGSSTVTNVTISGNSARDFGGGINNAGNGTLVLDSVTIYANAGDAGVNGVYNDGQVNLVNTIIAGTGLQCGGPSPLNTWGNNLASDYSCSLSTAKDDLLGTDPELGPLSDNGGPTFTHALLDNSPAIDTGNCTVTKTDQRGFSRPVDVPEIVNVVDGCDIGAFEVEVPEALAVVIDIKPGSDPNSINLNGNGAVAVAVLSTGDFDATTIDVSSVLFGLEGDDAAPVHGGHIEDVDDDGLDDLVLHFREGELGIPVDSEGNSILTLTLTGTTTGAVGIEGQDQVRITPNNPKSRGRGVKGPSNRTPT